MSLLNCALGVYGKLPDFFEKLRLGTAPEKFTRQHLKDIGFTSSNDYTMIPLLKGLGFLSQDGVPTETYMQLLDESRWKLVLGQALKQAYHDIFIIHAKPMESDVASIKGKYKSSHNLSDGQADRNARTFLALVELSQVNSTSDMEPLGDAHVPANGDVPVADENNKNIPVNDMRFHYNIQVHLPATKDVEVYNAIFKSLRENLID